MNPQEIQQFRELAEREENPNVLSRALGRVLDDYSHMRQLVIESLNGSEVATDALMKAIDEEQL
jgi:hypothetical protein